MLERLQKIIADAGLMSRRAAEKLIREGRSVSVQERVPAGGSFGEIIRLEEAEAC